ncbi:unnamed protein product [Sphagnum troendelagicum]|uniref:Uncharacterized protein n=1 Tax=Sphagnum troendelagicum TaxID=128251 RepID=A0ABP0TYK7_9BRYO
MEICSNAADSRIAKLEEFVLVAHRIRKAGRGTRPGLSNFKPSPRKGGPTQISSLLSGKNSLIANGSFVSASSELEKAPSSTISPPLEETIHEEGRIASSSQAITVALQDRTRSQQASEETQASPLRNDGGPQGELFQRPFLPAASMGIATSLLPERRIESSSGLCTPQTNSIAPQDRQRLQQTSKEAHASVLRCDGGPRGVFLQRSPSASAPLEVASRILESSIEGAEESYIKRPAGPLITIELKDISKLPGYIRISSMAEGAGTDDMISQKILYSGLPNQCRKCKRFGHHARSSTTSRNKPWEGAPSSAGPPSTSAPIRKQSQGGAPYPKQD